jgi:hypothetical protein
MDSIIPVLEPATLSKSPTTVKNPITMPPNIAAVGINSLNVPITDYYL